MRPDKRKQNKTRICKAHKDFRDLHTQRNINKNLRMIATLARNNQISLKILRSTG